jgi:Ni,Fe-hydrogenase III large subunit
MIINSLKIIAYSDFYSLMVELLEKEENHCVNYFCYPHADKLQSIACVANDIEHNIFVLSYVIDKSAKLELDSITPKITALHVFEREIFENFGVNFIGHPWLKPIRFPHNRANQNIKVNDYPFYKIKGEELHEVSVGPIHAGIIEPGHFHFICNGENVLHLEIQNGWQHRGVEQLMLDKKKLIQWNVLAESISGDTVVGHALAFAQAMESLADISVSEQLTVERSIALELERIAIHVGDIGALCTDVAYSLGANIFSILRTGIINFTQSWCGNRLGKGMVRVGGSNFAFTPELKESLRKTIADFEFQFIELAHKTFKLPSVENRFDDIGTISLNQVKTMGSVGMVARMANFPRDIRMSHPVGGYIKYPYETILLPKGDVFSRFLLRRKEIKKSIAWIKNILDNESFENSCEKPVSSVTLKPEMLCVTLVEGWRGEICHTLITDESGNLSFYKIKDPSLHNWKALELSLRNLEISDFPINNKSYNLSYCGTDL